MQYEIAVYLPVAVAFTPASPKKEPVHTVSVEIATVYASGPRPVKYAPPHYDSMANAIEEPRDTYGHMSRTGFM